MQPDITHRSKPFLIAKTRKCEEAKVRTRPEISLFRVFVLSCFRDGKKGPQTWWSHVAQWAVAILFVWRAAPAAGQQLAVLQKFPADLLPFTGGARPDAEGMVSYNKGGFKSPEFQRGAMHCLMRGVVEGNVKAMDNAWRAIDATFQRQLASGGFSRKGAPHGGPEGVAMWLSLVDQAILVVRESRLEPRYRNRIALLMPKIHKAARWLAQPLHQNALQRNDAQTPNRLLSDALAYGLSGILAGDADLKRVGRRFVELAMMLYRPSDGAFLEKGGADSSYQAVAAWNLQVWLIYMPDARLEKMVDRAVAWERGRVQPDGQIDVTGNTRTGLGQEQWMGHRKGVNLSEITLCLLYHYARTADPESLAAARRIVEWRRLEQRRQK